MTILDDDRTEAERLKLLPEQTQRDYVAMYWHKSQNSKLSQDDRSEANRKAAALEELLGFAKRSRV